MYSTQITDERIKHMHSVAELMYKYHDAFKCEKLSKNEVYILGLNHDIGYIGGSDGHETRGYIMFKLFGDTYTTDVISDCIRYHGVSFEEYMEIHQCDEKHIPNELILLKFADMMVYSVGEDAGKVVGFNRRLKRIKERDGEDSETYKSCLASVEFIKRWMKENIDSKDMPMVTQQVQS